MSAEKLFSRALDAGVIFLILFTPLAFGSVHIWAYTVMELVVFLLLALWAVKSFFARELKIDGALVPLYLSFAVFIAYAYLQTVPLPPGVVKALSPKAYELYSLAIPGYAGAETARSLSLYPYATKVDLLKFVAYLGAFFLITQEVRDKRRIKRFVLAFVIAGSIEAVYGLYGYFASDPYILGFKNIYYKESATGTFVNRNHFAGYLGIAMFAALGYLFAMAPGGSRAHYGLGQRVVDFLNTARATRGALILMAVLAMGLAVVFSLSRMGVFSLVVTLIITIMATARDMKTKLSKVLLAVVSLGLVAAMWYGLDPLEERYRRSSDDLFKSRLSVWQATGKLIGDYPVTGTGLGTYEHVFQRYKTPDIGVLIFQHAHNDYIQIVAETGAAGAAIAAFGGIYFLAVLFRKLSKRKDPVVRGMVLGAIGSMTYMSLHSITDFNMHIPSNALALFIAMALAYCAVETKGGENRQQCALKHRS